MQKSLIMAALASLIPLAGAKAAAMQFTGRSVQIYVCTAAEGHYAWHLKAPEAVLLDGSGKEAGHHFAGPSWQALDGSTIVGEPLVASAAPQPGSVPWLVLRVRSHIGEGTFAGVTYVARTQTEGGAAPASGCDPSHADAEIRIGYSATYVLFAP